MNNSSFVSALTGPKPSASRGPFAKALHGERLDPIESLMLRADGLAYRASRPMSEASSEPGVYKKGELERWMDDVARDKTIVKKPGDGGPVKAPKLKAGHAFKRPKELEGLTIDDLAAALEAIVSDAVRQRESIRTRTPGVGRVRLRENCFLESRHLCSCRRCVGGHA